MNPNGYRALEQLLNVFFHLLYNRFAGFYDLVADLVSTGLWKSWVYTILEQELQSPILEIGFGPGHLQAELIQLEDMKAFGIDASYRMNLLAFNRLRKNRYTFRLVNGYAQFMPFKSSYFRQVVATFPANFITEKPTWQEIRRVLAPDGRVIWLPAAWITGSSLLSRSAALLFKVTHQSPALRPEFDPDQFAPMIDAGFIITTEYKELAGSTVLLIHATPINEDDQENAGNSNRH